jgi:putative ABC transport system permease protein
MFREPVSHRALHELTRLPGVVHVEPLRAVAVEISHGSRRRRTSLQGLIAEPRLHRVVDGATTPMPLPADGLVLSTSLAEILGVERGDLVRIEALEGTRAVRFVPVAFLVDQHMGISAYMRLGTVRRFLREAPSLSGAFLQIEPSSAEGVYRQLKDSPKIAAVSRKSAFIESFRANVAKSMDLILVFAILFAVVITFGVVYNTARISLSERSRELASLRVLGFRRSEISYILLGELAVLAGAAIPTGFALGAALAWLALDSFGSELYRFPLVLTRQAFALAGLTVVVASLVSGLVVRRKLDRLDLIAVLKTRE